MKSLKSLIATCILLAVLNGTTTEAAKPIKVTVDWDKTIITSKTVPTVFVNPQPPGLPGPDEALRQIEALGARNMRFQPLPSPITQVIPAPRPPTKQSTSWDFTAMDAVTVPFMRAFEDREIVFNIIETPPWMKKGYDPSAHDSEGVLYGTRPVDYDSLTLSELKHAQSTLHLPVRPNWVDPSGEQLAEYYARMYSWYTHGGFVDENGKYHHSGHNFRIPWWEVLGEVNWQMTPEEYVTLYDAVVSAIQKVDPTTKFIGLAIGPIGMADAEGPARDSNIKYVEYFLNPDNHRPGIPLDMVSYHFYEVPAFDQTIESWQFSLFDQAESLLNNVAYLEAIRKRLSPSTKVNISELGIILPYDIVAVTAILKEEPDAAEKIALSQAQISPAYWNLSGALFAYLWVELSKQGIDIVTASELMVGNSRVFPSINLIDPVTGKPNARLQALRLLVDNFNPGDRLVQTRFDHFGGAPAFVAVQAFATDSGRKLLLINKRMRTIDFDLSALGPVIHMDVVDEASGGDLPRREPVAGKVVQLPPFAVAVIDLGDGD